MTSPANTLSSSFDVPFEDDVFSSSLLKFAAAHPEVLALSADLGDSCELVEFRDQLPDRYLYMGISEQNMVSWAAGLAREGFRPVVCTFGVFLYRRALDQIEMSIASSGLPVILVGFVPGLTTSRGRAHQATNDIAVLRSIPGLTIFDCADATQVESVLEAAYAVNGPVYIRMLRRKVPRLFAASTAGVLSAASVTGAAGKVGSESDYLVVSSSVCTLEAHKAVSELATKGYSIRHLNIAQLKPFGDEALLQALQTTTKAVISIENHSVVGGLGSCIAELMQERGISTPLIKLGLQDTYAQSGSQAYLLSQYGLDAQALISTIEQLP